MPDFFSVILSHVAAPVVANLPCLILAASISLLLGALWGVAGTREPRGVYG
jgi:hypothetical protein